MFWKKIKSTRWPEVAFLTAISALVYLPRLPWLTFNKDDWYFLYDGFVVGPKAFIDITLHTRPARGPLYELLFSLYGIHPLPYHLTLYFLRLLGALGALWLFHLLWPKHRGSNLFMALFFLIFPGFLWWLGAFEFQPYVLSVGLQAFSMVFTLKSIGSDVLWKRLAWLAGAFLFGWGCLALVEYAIGMEAFRILCVYLYVRQRSPQPDLGKLLLKTVRSAAVFLLIPVGFVIWYQFFFENWRKAQEAGAQLSQLFSSPLTGLWWLVRLFESVLNVSLLAWAVPFYENYFAGRLGDILFAALFAGAAIVIVWLVDRSMRRAEEARDDADRDRGGRWQMDAVLIGLLGTLAGVLPIVVANRSVTFDRYSQYVLPASLAGVVWMGGIVYSIFPKSTRSLVVSALVGIAALTHHAVASQALAQEKAIRDFWWQVTWRAPSIRTDSTLVAVYPDVDYADGDEVVWGPANFIYHPERQAQMPVVVPISAARMEPATITNIAMSAKDYQKVDLVVKDVTLNYYFGNILLLARSSAGSCVHAIDRRWPDLSTADDAFVIASSSKSNVENILPAATSPVPPKTLFGSEPAHDWCYYYQRADLARQGGDWQAVARLAQEAQKLGLHPNDQIEWMPFLQAYAYLGDAQGVKEISRKINTVDFYRYQACQTLGGMDKNGYPLPPDMVQLSAELFCPSRK